MNAATCPSHQDPRDELDILSRCLAAVADLLAAETDLHTVDRDNLAALLAYLVDRQRLAQAARRTGAA